MGQQGLDPPFPLKVSPKYEITKLQSGKIEDKIDVFEDQIKGWILDHALWLVDMSYAGARHAGIAALMLVSTYFEAFAEFDQGVSSDGKSGKFFRHGFLSVFPETRDMAAKSAGNKAERAIKQVAAALYGQLRCGLFHEGMIGNKVVLTDGASPLRIFWNQQTEQVVTIIINPQRFALRIRDAFEEYIRRLRDANQKEARAAFERFWDTRAARQGAYLASPEELRTILQQGRWHGRQP